MRNTETVRKYDTLAAQHELNTIDKNINRTIQTHTIPTRPRRDDVTCSADGRESRSNAGEMARGTHRSAGTTTLRRRRGKDGDGTLCRGSFSWCRGRRALTRVFEFRQRTLNAATATARMRVKT